jgi:hypothetical protein
MIDYSKTQNTLQALYLMFPNLPKICIQKTIMYKDKKITRETQLINFLTNTKAKTAKL